MAGLGAGELLEPDPHHGVVVGVTAPGENTAALHWAAREARARRTVVTLVHAVEPVLPPPPGVVLVDYPDLLDVGKELTSGVSEEYAEIVGADDEPSSRCLVERGHPASVLCRLSERAELVVLAHRDLSAFRRVFTGSVSTAVAAHAQCPVVSVPVGWRPRAEGGAERPDAVRPTDDTQWVTVGVHESGTPQGGLEAAFEAAVLHGLGVRLVYAWRLDSEYDELIVRRVGADWETRVHEELNLAVEPFTGKHPDVPVSVRALHDWPADALMRLSRRSELVVVGRHGSRRRAPQRIGSIARTLLREAACPTMVVPV